MWWIYFFCLIVMTNCVDVRVHHYITIGKEAVYRSDSVGGYHELQGQLTIDLYQFDEFQFGYRRVGHPTGYTISMKGYRYGTWLETSFVYKTELAYNSTKIYIDQLRYL